MNDAEFNAIVANYIADKCNRLMETAKPFPSEKVEELQTSIYETMQALGELYRALQEYNNGKTESLLKLK